MTLKENLKDLDSQKIPCIKLSYINPVPFNERPVIKSSLQAGTLLMAQYDPETIELFESSYVMLLGRSNRVIGIRKLTDGDTDKTFFCKRLILQTALLTNATSIIMSHNHPSGQCSPSQADIKATREMVQILKVADIQLLDHIIVTPQGETYSMADGGDIS